MRTRLVIALLTLAVFLGGAFGLGYSTGASTVNNRIDCRQAHDEQLFDIFRLLVLDFQNPAGQAQVIGQLRGFGPAHC